MKNSREISTHDKHSDASERKHTPTSDHRARNQSLIGMGLHPHEFENMQHRQSDQQARDSGSSDSGRKNPEMLEQSQQKWETLRKKKQLLHQEIQNKSIPEKLNTIHQWYETQRNEIPLDQNKIKKENNPEM